jgi:hypothetical protein
MASATAYGMYRFTKMAWGAGYLVRKHMFRGIIQSRTRMLDTYGQKDSWAVVTGGSDGIGLAMCNNLAS